MFFPKIWDKQFENTENEFIQNLFQKRKKLFMKGRREGAHATERNVCLDQVIINLSCLQLRVENGNLGE